MNEEGHQILRLAVGLYLAYLAYMLISAQMAGDTGMSDVVAYVGGGILGLGGLGFCDYALVRYFKERKARQEKKDISSEEEP